MSRLSRLLLHLFPARFRRRYGEEIFDLLATQARDVRARSGWYGVTRMWAYQSADLLRAAWAERRGVPGGGPRPARPAGRASLARASSPRRPGSGHGRGRAAWAGASLAQDVRYAVRTLWASPGFTLVAIATLALGIGATSAIFTVVDGVLLAPLPYPDPGRLVAVYQRFHAPGRDDVDNDHTSSVFLTYREDNATFEQLGAWAEGAATLTGPDGAERVDDVGVTEGVLRALAVPPLLGRVFTADDTVPGAPPTVVLGFGYWQRRFAADRGVVGTTIRLDGIPVVVIGVMPRGFRFLGREPALYVPIKFDVDEMPTVLSFDYRVMGRLRPQVSRAEAIGDLERLIPVSIERYAWISRSQLGEWRLGADVIPLKDAVVGDIGGVLWLLLGTVSLVLVIACTNVANLLLVRARGRRSEVAVRTAMGASRGRLAVQFVVESMVLAVCSGLLGLAMAYASLPALLRLAPSTLPRANEISLSPAVLAFAVLVSTLAGVVFGLAPLAGYGVPDLVASLKDEGRSASGGRKRHRAGTALAVVEVALALVLVIGAGLMARTFVALREIDPGFSEPRRAFTFRLALPPAAFPGDDQVIAAHQQLIDGIARIPGVMHAGATSGLTMEGHSNQNSFMAEDVPVGEGEGVVRGAYKAIAGDYFEAMGIPLLAGRAITWDDIRNRRRVGVVSEKLARDFWGEPAAAIGKHIRNRSDDPWREVVGVVGSVRDGGIRGEPRPLAYWPVIVENFLGFDVWARRNLAFVVRTEGSDPFAVLPEVRAAVWAVSPDLPLTDIRRLDDLVARDISSTSFQLTMLLLAASVAVALGAIGVYGVIAHVFAQRTRELGIRMALGARRADILALVLRQGALVAAGGVLIGLAAAAAASRLLSALVFGVETLDVATYAAGAVAVIGIALLASYIPGRRATRLDPSDSLRW